MSTPYLPVHGFIIDGELTNSPELFVAAVENKQPVMVGTVCSFFDLSNWIKHRVHMRQRRYK
jgi:hypothetical protein